MTQAAPDPAKPAPLSEADPFSLEEFLSRSPYTLSKSDLEKMVLLYREQRKRWLLDEAAGKKRASKTKTSPTSAHSTIKLDDLDFT